MSRASRTVAALALAALFLTSLPAAAAAPPAQNGVASLWNAAWQWLADLILPGGPDRPEPGPNTNGGDPNGDTGGGIDPDGVRMDQADRGTAPERGQHR